MGCGNDVFLLGEVTKFLRGTGRSGINRCVDHLLTSVWHQGWLSGERIDFPTHWISQWDNYIKELKHAHIHLNMEEDRVAWVYDNSRGDYSAKLRYSSSMDGVAQIERW